MTRDPTIAAMPPKKGREREECECVFKRDFFHLFNIKRILCVFMCVCYIKPVWSCGSMAKRWWPCLSVMPSFADFGWPSTIDNVWISSNITSTYHQCVYAIRPNRLMRGRNIFHTMYATAYVARSRMLKRTRSPLFPLIVVLLDSRNVPRRYAQKCVEYPPVARNTRWPFRLLRSLIAIKWCELVFGKWMNLSFYMDLTGNAEAMLRRSPKFGKWKKKKTREWEKALDTQHCINR